MIRALLATALLGQLDRVERRVLGRRPVYAPERMFGPAAGPAARWAYGATLGALQRRARLPALLFGPLVAAVELVVLPAIGATPPVRKWPRGEVPLLFAHATAFALAT